MFTTHYTTLFVALDIGKNVNWLAAYAGSELQAVVEPLKVRSHRPGFEQVTACLDAQLHSGAFSQVVLGHEPTGVYHETWAHALAARYEAHRTGQAAPRLDYRFINPVLVKRQRQTLSNARQRKTDAIDLRAIALCLRDGQGQPAFLPTAEALRFQVWGRAYRQASRQRRQFAVQLLADLDRLWPGLVVQVKRFRRMHPQVTAPVPLVQTRPLERKTVQAILQHCPNPHDFLALGPAGIQTFLRQHVGRCGPVTAGRADRIVRQAVLPPPDLAAVLADQLQQDMARYLALSERLAALVEQAETLVPTSPAAVLTTIPGVSPLLAARYLAYLGHPQRFQSAAEIWAFAGFDPVTSESGDARRVGHISRKGQPGLRDTLYLLGLHTATHIPAFKKLKARARQRGLTDVGATIHVAHKANRLCHHLLYHQQPFDPNRVR